MQSVLSPTTRWVALISLSVVPLALSGCGVIDIAKLIWPNRFDLNKQFEELQDAGCSGFCALNGFGEGLVVGTGPICEASCANDCPGFACIAPLPGQLPGGNTFMPDAGALCTNTALTAASEVFSDDPLDEKWKTVLMTPGKSCCCQTRLPMEGTVMKDKPTTPGTVSCDDWCQGGGNGHGVTVGTAPLCGASCADDCAGNVCVSSNNFFSDHGAGCATGDKVCCCAAQNVWPHGFEMWKDAVGWWSPPEKMSSTFSCTDFCNSGDWGGGEVIGSAPFCGGSCSGDCAGRKCVTVSHGDVTDYGHACTSGDKVCCCEGGESKTLV